MSPVTGLARDRLPGQILWCVHMGNFSPVDQDEFKKHNQNGGTINLYYVRTLWTLVTFLIKLFRVLLTWKYIQDQNYCIPFWPLSGESEAILSKMFRPGHQGGVFIWENFHPCYQDLGRKNRNLGNRASPAPHMNTSIFL